MQDVILRFFVHEGEKHGHELLYEWLLGAARQAGISGGSAFRAIAGYGRTRVLHEQHFFELAGSLPVQVSFFTNREAAEKLLTHVAAEGLKLVYSVSATELGLTGLR